ncbi:hypothetical protein FB45DRAFT_948315 [Roridomyces roridus]|uniref:SRPBCC domain-containing protein n=1 Tax=Roridomyces roridus TaxID=1738132 RepID=A0AAD7B1U1_9AGAR|nr:hypothetical protein FB45DRAFT_948315 [Roridomyces roridus]
MPTSKIPSLKPGVFTVSDSILIDAPIEKVWEVLMDFGRYHEWNAFVRGQTLITPTGTPLPSQTPTAGLRMRVSPVHLPPTMGEPGWGQSHSTVVRITTVDEEGYRASWVTEGSDMFRWMLDCERWQVLTTEEVEGRTRTKYESVEVFRGPVAYVVWMFTGGNLRKGVSAMAEGLKRHAEGLVA